MEENRPPNKCVFCGKQAKELRQTSLGLYRIHSSCIPLLEEMFNNSREFEGLEAVSYVGN